MGLGLLTEFIAHFQPLIAFHCGAIANSITLQFTESSQYAVSSPALWYQLLMVEVPIPLGSRTVLITQPQQLFTNSELNWNLTPV
jgi:hypothetical protein